MAPKGWWAPVRACDRCKKGRAGHFARRHLPRRAARMATLSKALSFFAPEVQLLEFPAWDCLPYDRVSPNAVAIAQRMTTLSRLARVRGRDKPSVLMTTVNAALQRVPARDFVAVGALSVAPGNVIGMQGIVGWLDLRRLCPRFNRARARRVRGARRDSRSLSTRHGYAGAARFLRRCA